MAAKQSIFQLANKILFNKYFTVFFYIFIAGFLTVYLKNIDYHTIGSTSFNFTYLLVAVVFGVLTRYFSGIIWLVVLSGLGARNLLANFWTLLYVYAKSWMGRYIPGTAPWILGKIHFASRLGISKTKLAIGSVLEGAIEIVAVMAFSFAMLIFDPRLNVISGGLKLLMTVVLILCLIALIPKVFNALVSKTYVFLRKEKLENEHLASGSLILKASGLYIISAIINGISLFFIAKSIYPTLGYDSLIYVMSVGNLAGAIGMLIVFVPSGFGIRDGIQLVLLSLIMPKEIALLVTVLTRLLGVGLDFLFFGLTSLMKQLKPLTTR